MPDPPPMWAVVANVVPSRRVGPGAHEVRRGTKHFKPNAKVVVVGDHGGMAEFVDVVGRSRQGQFILVTMRVWWLHNFRVKLIYSPAVIRRAVEWNHLRVERATRESAEVWAENYRAWIRSSETGESRKESPGLLLTSRWRLPHIAGSAGAVRHHPASPTGLR